MEPGAPARRGWRKLIGIATATWTLCACAGIALAGGGGVGAPGSPSLSDVICLDHCAGARIATAGSKVQLRGHNLEGVGTVKFAADGGGRVAATPTAATATTVEALVPDDAATGTVHVIAYGVEAETEQTLRIVDPGQITTTGNFGLNSAEATPHSTFYDRVRPPAVTYVFHGEASTGVRVEVVNRDSGEVVATSIEPAAEANTSNVSTWDGLTSDGLPAPNGDYKFRIGDAAGSGAEATADSGFDFHLYRFPLDAKHTYGDGYGAGRGHEGQDVFARCGSPIRVVRGGRIQANTSQSAAGNYVVVDGKGTGVDTFYAHLIRRSPLRVGSRVHTGQVIGNVGQTGNASGCHLHFEIWSAPGWYEGGHALPSVGRLMHRWDSWS